MKRVWNILTLAMTGLSLLAALPANAQMSKVKTVWVILMENHNWTGNDAGAAFGAPDIKGNPLAPYINGELLNTSAHAEQYFNPAGNHPSQPNYFWLEAGTNFGVLADTQPGQPQLDTTKHLVTLLQNAGISWRAYAEPDFGSPVFDVCPLDFTYLDVEHLAFVYFDDVNNGLDPLSPNVSPTSDPTTNWRPTSPTTRQHGTTSSRRMFAMTATRASRLVTALNLPTTRSARMRG